MEFNEVLKRRRSTRKFLNRVIADRALDRIMDQANMAPSAGNLKSFSVAVAKDENLREKLMAAAYGQDAVASASAVIVVNACPSKAEKYGERGRRLYAVQDATIYAAYLQLAAVEAGLASVWIGSFDEAAVRRALALPADQIPVAMIPIGYAAETTVIGDRPAATRPVIKRS